MNSSVSTTSGKLKIKIVLLGDQGVGKSCIIDKYVKDRFDESSNPTVGIDFLVKNVTYNAKSYRLQLWDTAGQERFRALIPNYLKDARCALFIVDVSSRRTLENAESWLRLYNDNRIGDGFSVMVGNKIDLQERQFTFQQGLEHAKALQLPYFEISAKSGQNVEELFSNIIEVIENRKMQVFLDQGNKKDQASTPSNNPPNAIGMKQSQSKNAPPLPAQERNKNSKAEHDQQSKIVLKNEPIKKDPIKKGCC